MIAVCLLLPLKPQLFGLVLLEVLLVLPSLSGYGIAEHPGFSGFSFPLGSLLLSQHEVVGSLLGVVPVLLRKTEVGRSFVLGSCICLGLGGLHSLEMADFLFSFRRLARGPEGVGLFLCPHDASVDLGLPGRLAGLLVRGGIA